MSLGVHSEVGRLREVMVHRPAWGTPGWPRRTPKSCSSTTCCGCSEPSRNTTRPARSCGNAGSREREWVDEVEPALVADSLISGLTTADVTRHLGRMWQSSPSTTVRLPSCPTSCSSGTRRAGSTTALLTPES